MTRAAGWQQRLRCFLDQAAFWKYDLVEANCGHFILGVIASVTNDEPRRICERLAIEMPTDERGVLGALAKGGGMRGLAVQYFGHEAHSDMLNAREGDVAVLDGEDGETLGLVEGGGVLCVAANGGLVRIRLDQAKGYWPL